MISTWNIHLTADTGQSAQSYPSKEYKHHLLEEIVEDFIN